MNGHMAESGRYVAAGFSLIETVITLVILAIALTAVTRSISFGVGQSANPLWQTRAVQLAQSYLDDALALNFQQDSPLGGGSVGRCVIDGPEGGESGRSDFDDVDDFHGLSEQGRFLDGALLAAVALYQVDVQVSCQDGVGNVSSRSKLIQVTVSGPDNQRLRLSALRGNF